MNDLDLAQGAENLVKFYRLDKAMSVRNRTQADSGASIIVLHFSLFQHFDRKYMSIRTFIFCDICNPQGFRSIEFRRSTRMEERSGRRISDGRAWLEASLEQAVAAGGWLRTNDGRHICPACQSLHELNS